jgi:hypothetical protein
MLVLASASKEISQLLYTEKRVVKSESENPPGSKAEFMSDGLSTHGDAKGSPVYSVG